MSDKSSSQIRFIGRLGPVVPPKGGPMLGMSTTYNVSNVITEEAEAKPGESFSEGCISRLSIAKLTQRLEALRAMQSEPMELRSLLIGLAREISAGRQDLNAISGSVETRSLEELRGIAASILRQYRFQSGLVFAEAPAVIRLIRLLEVAVDECQLLDSVRSFVSLQILAIEAYLDAKMAAFIYFPA